MKEPRDLETPLPTLDFSCGPHPREGFEGRLSGLRSAPHGRPVEAVALEGRLGLGGPDLAFRGTSDRPEAHLILPRAVPGTRPRIATGPTNGRR
jgi:hypothetical protein